MFSARREEVRDLVVGHAASYPFPNAKGMYNDMAKAAKIVVTKVRCRKCGKEQTVNGGGKVKGRIVKVSSQHRR